MKPTRSQLLEDVIVIGGCAAYVTSSAVQHAWLYLGLWILATLALVPTRAIRLYECWLDRPRRRNDILRKLDRNTRR